MTESLADPRVWVPVLALVIQGVGLWAFWSLCQKFVGRDSCGKCKEEMAKRLGAVESKSGTAPTCTDLGEIRREMEEIRGDIKVVQMGQKGQKDILERIEVPLKLLMEHHMGGGK